MSHTLPPASPQALAHSQALLKHIMQAHEALPFDAWMQQLLYAPTYGYYTGSLPKLGAQGDFTTAPEISPWFGRGIAPQLSQILAHSQSEWIVEFGAGSGQLAQSLLTALPDCRYAIVEVSPSLRQRQQSLLAPFGDRVQWWDALPKGFCGAVLGNELLDAMPAKRIAYQPDRGWQEQWVHWPQGNPAYDYRPLSPSLQTIVQTRLPATLPHPYHCEINLCAEAWIRYIGEQLQRGGVLLIDYGYPGDQYYHPQRSQGTLRCHWQHHAHDNALVLAGLQDITTHVDFTAMADTALSAQLEVLGYTSQARFLLNNGLLQALAQALDPNDVLDYAQNIGPVQRLLSESEMGELFKVLLLGKDLDIDPIGFSQGDRRHRLVRHMP